MRKSRTRSNLLAEVGVLVGFAMNAVASSLKTFEARSRFSWRERKFCSASAIKTFGMMVVVVVVTGFFVSSFSFVAAAAAAPS